jgi:hypothetical protein
VRLPFFSNRQAYIDLDCSWQQLSSGRRPTQTTPRPMRSCLSWVIKVNSYEASLLWFCSTILFTFHLHSFFLFGDILMSIEAFLMLVMAHEVLCNPCSLGSFSCCLPDYRPEYELFFARCSSTSPYHPCRIMTLKTIYIVRHGFRLNWQTTIWWILIKAL